MNNFKLMSECTVRKSYFYERLFKRVSSCSLIAIQHSKSYKGGGADVYLSNFLSLQVELTEMNRNSSCL